MPLGLWLSVEGLGRGTTPPAWGPSFKPLPPCRLFVFAHSLHPRRIYTSPRSTQGTSMHARDAGGRATKP